MNAKVMMLGTFHFNHINDMRSEASQAQIMDVVDKLSVFMPNKIAVEERVRRQRKIDERFRLYSINGNTDTKAFTIYPRHIHGETIMLGFQTALKCNINKVYAIDYMRLFFYEKPIKQAKRNNPAIANEIIGKQKDFREYWTQNVKNKPLKDALIFLNSKENISKLHNSDYLSLNQVGASTHYLGTRTLTSWHKRNLGIFANLQALCKDGDRVLVIYGAGHLSTLNAFIHEYDKMDFIDPLEYLNNK